MAYVLSARGLDTQRDQLEKLRRRHGGRRERAGDPPVLERRGDLPRRGRLPRRVRRVPHPRRARPPCRPRAAPAHRAVRWRAPPRRARAHPVRRHRQPRARRAHQPPRRRRQGVADGLPPLVPRRAARREPRPRAARPGDHEGAAPRRGRPARVQGHVHAVPRCAREGRRAPAQDRGTPASRDRAPLHARRQDAALEREACPAGEEPRQARRTARVGRGHADPLGAHRSVSLSRSAAQRARRRSRSTSSRSRTAIARSGRISRSRCNAASAS